MSALVILQGSAFAADPEGFRFRGDGSSRLPVFTVAGPWTMDWSTRSDLPALASIEIRLYDSESGNFIGMVAELKGTGRGFKLFADAGNYQLVIVGTSVDWDIQIKEVSEEQAASLKQEADGEPSLLDTSRRVSSRVPQGSFVSWRPEGDDTLLLLENGDIGWRVSFLPPKCPGLDTATALSFVTPVGDTDAGYDSILLDTGTRCYFERVISDLAP